MSSFLLYITVFTSRRTLIANTMYFIKTEELLRSAGDGNPAATSQVHNLLRILHSQSIAAQAAAPLPKLRAPHAPKIRASPGAPKVVDIRPLPQEKLTGIRRVPVITAATGGYPFLRFGKPQSQFLSRVLRQKVQRKQRRTDYLNKMQVEIELGREEALWEEYVLDALKNDGATPPQGIYGRLGADWAENGWGGRGWMKDVKEVRDRMRKDMTEEQRRSKALGEKMLEIVGKEKELWKEERGERRHEKKLAKKARKMEEKEHR